MGWEADQHRDWHTLNALEGGKGMCPWDCGANEEPYEPEGPLVTCGFCGQKETIDEVRFCSKAYYANKAKAAQT